jgi:hypothetical protein
MGLKIYLDNNATTRCDDETLEKYDIKELPSLLVFKGGLLTGHIDGYYSCEEKEKMLESLMNLL